MAAPMPPFSFSHYNPAEGGWMWRDASGQLVSSQDIAAYGQTAPNPPGAHTFPGGVLPTSAGGAPSASPASPPAPAASSSYSPEGLAAAFRQPDVTLPGAAEAKGELRGLQLSGVRGLETLLAEDPQAAREGLRKAIYAPAASDINFQADRAKQGGLETMFGRNVGASTITGDYVLEPVERARLAALERAANDAFVQANTLANQNATSRAEILGRAFNEGTTGLQGEANVEASNAARNAQTTQAGYTSGLTLQENAANRAQQESQYGRSLSQQGSQFGQSLSQQAALQREAFENAQSIADKATTAASVGAGIGGLAQFFAPTANSALQRLFGLT